MVQEALLNLILAFYLILVFKESSLITSHISLPQIREKLHQIRLTDLTLPFVYLLITFIFLILSGHTSLLSIYFYLSLSMLVVLHFFWLNHVLNNKFLLIIPLVVIIARVFYPNTVTHGIFMILTASWLGPVFSIFRLFKTKVFIYGSIIWFLYDIYYAWLSMAAQRVSQISTDAKLSLALTVGELSIGLADLFFASLLLSILKTRLYKIIACCLLILLNILLAFFASRLDFNSIFPLLVLWVPCGLLLLGLEKLSIKKS